MNCSNCGNNLYLLKECKYYKYFKPCKNCFSDIIEERPNLIIQEKKSSPKNNKKTIK